MLDKYLDEYSIPNKAFNTSRTDRGLVNHLLKYFGDIPLMDVTPQKISSYKAKCRKSGEAPATTKHRLTVLKHAFNIAIREWEWLTFNPMERVGMVKVSNSRDRWLSFDEEKRLLEACLEATRENNLERKTFLLEIVFFALNTGMRQDEILSLKWVHVDFSRRTAMVVRSKNGEKRTIPLNQGVCNLLIHKAKKRPESDFVFPSEAETKVDQRNLRRAFYRALEIAEIEDFKFHDLRHTFATRLAQKGIDLYKISKLLGHKDIKMTQRYAHHYTESLREGVDVLDGFITFLSQSAVLEEFRETKLLN
jgi:integrase